LGESDVLSGDAGAQFAAGDCLDVELGGEGDGGEE
jgi:hypothetical protein